jgi:DNA-binding MarR family transcriptional regulator
VSRFARPEELGPYLEENARAWEAILDGADASPLAAFGRLEALARAWAQLHRDVLGPCGVNYAELSTLGRLRTNPGGTCSPGELRSLVGQTSAGMTRILDKLETQGFVRRAAHADDGRRIEVRLTARGAQFSEQCLEALLAVESRLLAGLGKRRLDSLVAGIDSLLSALADRRAEAEDPRAI